MVLLIKFAILLILLAVFVGVVSGLTKGYKKRK